MSSLLARLRAHLGALWPRHGAWPALVFGGWPAFSLLRGEARAEHLLLGLAFGVLPYVGPRSKRLFLGLLPLGLVGVFYDSMRFFQHAGVTAERIHVCDLRSLEMRLFGVPSAAGTTTVDEFLAPYRSLGWDLFFAAPYGTFLLAVVLFGVFLCAEDDRALRRFTWAFFATNIAGFAAHHLWPSAPPWYYHAHGCVADPLAQASEGAALARVDAFLGAPYFHGFYARSRDVFGAVPSLHVAYPTLMLLEGWSVFGRRARWLAWALRAASVGFVLWMAAAAVYLEHHWVVDLVVGALFAVLAFSAARFTRAHPAPEGASAAREVTVT